MLIALAWGEDSRWHATRIFGSVYTDQLDYAMYRWIFERHGVAIPILITGARPGLRRVRTALAP